ncbi:MAG: hypothetical protein A3F10_04045 [Coxiella sp. RIFCSPHIGHO2_12_FULL_42_15]|nr:MAG: hypothetical protein A3F10_04045 [Coxiella sp. RIFCSPHIGHO2_12_FULL_42_15]
MFVNIAGYKFISIAFLELNAIRDQLREYALQLEIKGTILLSTEGVNIFVAGSYLAMDDFKKRITAFAPFADMHFKENESPELPFSKMLVRIKNEIIAMGHEEVRPEHATAPYIDPVTLQQWYEEKRDFVILDTRNDYEVAVGTFENAIDLNIENFRQFPDAVKMLPAEMKQKPVVTFCTGGIRCEKAAAYMQQQGFKEVYQLSGGILNYFEKMGGTHYRGECFVFDKRLTVDTKLNSTETECCFAHRSETETNTTCPYCQHLRQSRKTEPQL